MLTSRDFEILEFLENYKVANTTILQYFFFPSLSACQKRLLKLVQSKQLKRARDSINNEYIYYIKKPKQLNHSLKITELYMELSKKYEIIHFKTEVGIGSIRPDAIFGYKENNKAKIGMLEVELSNKDFNIKKYEYFVKSGEAKQSNIYDFQIFLWTKRKKIIEILKV